jgi:branched-chain amino acid transport system permease protein
MWKKTLDRLGPLFVVLLVTVLRYLFPNKISFFTEIAIYTIYVMGNNILYGYLGLVSFGQPFYLGIGGYATALFLAYVGHNPLVALLLGIGSGLVFGIVLGPSFIRLKSSYFALINAALCAIGVFIFERLLIDITRGNDGLWFRSNMSKLPLLDVRLPQSFFLFVVIVLFLVLMIYRHLDRSTLGTMFRGLQSNEEKLKFIGYDTFKIKWVGFTIASCFSTFAGSLYAINFGFVNPSLGENSRAVEVIVATLLGGSGTVYGPFFGAFAFLGIKDIVSRWITRWELVVGILTILVLFRFSKGIWGTIQQYLVGIQKRVSGSNDIRSPKGSRSAGAGS